MNLNGQTTKSRYGRGVREEVRRLLTRNEQLFEKGKYRQVLDDKELLTELRWLFPQRKWIPDCYANNMSRARSAYNAGRLHSGKQAKKTRTFTAVRYVKKKHFIYITTARGRVLDFKRMDSKQKKGNKNGK